MVAAVCGRLRAVITGAAARGQGTLRRLTRPLPLITGLAGDLVRPRRELIAQNMLLRQPLVVASRNVKRSTLQPHDRGLLVLLAWLAPRWRDALLLVKPDTAAPGGSVSITCSSSGRLTSTVFSESSLCATSLRSDLTSALAARASADPVRTALCTGTVPTRRG